MIYFLTFLASIITTAFGCYMVNRKGNYENFYGYLMIWSIPICLVIIALIAVIF